MSERARSDRRDHIRPMMSGGKRRIAFVLLAVSALGLLMAGLPAFDAAAPGSGSEPPARITESQSRIIPPVRSGMLRRTMPTRSRNPFEFDTARRAEAGVPPEVSASPAVLLPVASPAATNQWTVLGIAGEKGASGMIYTAILEAGDVLHFASAGTVLDDVYEVIETGQDFVLVRDCRTGGTKRWRLP